MDREAARHAWSSWVRTSIGGDAARQAHVVEAILAALERGAGTAEATDVGRQAAANGRGWNVVAPADPAPVRAAPSPDTTPPAATPAVSNPGGIAALANDSRVLGGLVAVGVVVALAIVAVMVIQPGTPAEAQRTATQIFADSRASLLEVASYRAVVKGQSEGKSGSSEVWFQDKGTARQEVNVGSSRLQVLAAGGKLYFNGNADFYGPQPVLAQHAADQWIQATPDASVLDPADFTPDVGASCVFDKHGTLTRKGVSTIGDRKVVEIDDAGDKPGATPARFFIAAEGRADLLRVEVTGPTRPGAFDDQCVRGFGLQSKATRLSETLDLVDLNTQFDIPPSVGSLDLAGRPFCGTPVSPNLSEAARQYLLINYDRSLLLTKVEGECGCPFPTFASLRLAWSDEVAADQEFISRIQKLPVDGNQKAAINAAVAAYATVIRDVQARIAGGGNANRVAADVATAVARQDAVRRALGLGPNPCGYSIPD